MRKLVRLGVLVPVEADERDYGVPTLAAEPSELIYLYSIFVKFIEILSVGAPPVTSPSVMARSSMPRSSISSPV